MQITDQQQRHQALDPTQSFIVQAPAGSGKTELLTQRFLNLLTTVDKNPEEVLAITFTRKAANEMRQRILAALQLAKGEKPSSAHKQNTWQLAQRVLQRNQQEKWDLLNNPNRLRIQTIDSLCAYLAKQLPLLSQLGSEIGITDDAEQDYQQAVDATLAGLENDVTWADALAKLLLHLDNNTFHVKQLLVSMLSHRDQWLPHIINAKNNADLREHLELALQAIITECLQQTKQLFPHDEHQNVLTLLNYARDLELETFPSHNQEHLPIWQTIAEFCLTQKHEWRKKLDKRNGFPASGATKQETEHFKNLKARALALIERLSNSESLRLQLKECLLLPPPHYNDNQWQIITALMELLPILAAHLNIIFQQKGHVDFIEITQRALLALNNQHTPTDLALALDYRLKHILVDEFQDTSATQFHLLELLTQGWQQDDGRTLFLVGDPMQSIYRFRAAEVGLFLQAKQHGLGDLPLIPLTLKSNFRSNQLIVEWFNNTFATAFPSQENIALGAISYSQANAVNTAQDSAIHYHHAPAELPLAEADAIRNIINANPEREIAILVKSRSHLDEIIPVLKLAQIPFQAVEIETLGHLPFIQDLCSLSFALSHFAHRLAWLSILRAPWCGLTLQDLHTLANSTAKQTLWECLNNTTLVNNLTADGQQRVIAFRDIMQTILQQRGRMSLSAWVKSAWLALGGPATLRVQDNLNDSNAFFDLLSQLEQGGQLSQLSLLEEKLLQLYAQPQAQHSHVHVMTIHKAKGLEFYTVIIPRLESYTANDKSKLLLWQQRPGGNENIDLLLAPIKARKESTDPIYDYVKHFEQRKNLYENTRLFYVAATRAKREIHLLANSDDLDKAPRKGSFLDVIWPLYKQDFVTLSGEEPTEKRSESDALRRFKLPYRANQKIQNMLPNLQLFSTTNANMPKWQSEEERKRGIVLHRLLQQFSQFPVTQWPQYRNNTALLTILLQQEEVIQLEPALAFLHTALDKIIPSETAQWILSPHEDAQSELELFYNDHHYVIDRTFTDNNIRWIIDYKSTTPLENEPLEQFYKRQYQQHTQQLENYAKIMRDYTHHPIKLMLYFPLIDESYVWDYAQDVAVSS